MSQISNVTPQNDTVRMEVGQEVRFAVVMFGGVSLAIYMNGVAQELLTLVRVTAWNDDDTPRFSNEELSGVERVYRQLGQILGRDDEDRVGPWDPDRPPDVPIRTRFVIDILSGTSAGGINAIFLAKALANGQDMSLLKRLWISEGDIAKLINDKIGADWGLPPQKPPLSLLSSQRMYFKLVDAFDGMEEEAKPTTLETRSPYVEELDLFVTATDLDGLPLPLRLADDVV